MEFAYKLVPEGSKRWPPQPGGGTGGGGVQGAIVDTQIGFGDASNELTSGATARIVSGQMILTQAPQSIGAGADSEQWGNGALAGGLSAVALGNAASASGIQAMALGKGSTASGANDATALGANAQATASNTLAAGVSASASVLGAIAIGRAAAASGTLGSLAIGNNSMASNTRTIALGEGSIASGLNATAVGVAATASGNQTTVFGRSASATGTGSCAFGDGASVNNTQGVAIGADSSADTINSVAIGYVAQADFNRSVAIGHQALVTATNQFVSGSSNSPIEEIYIGNGVVNTIPNSAGLLFSTTGGSGTDVSCTGNLTIAGPRGTGTGTGGHLVFQTAEAGATGSSLNALATILELTDDQAIGMYGVTPVVQSASWTAITNPVTRKTFDTTTVTLSELAEFVGTLRDALENIGILRVAA